MSPLTDHLQCSDMTSSLSQLCSLSSFLGCKRELHQQSHGQSSWNLSHKQDPKPGMCMWMFVPSQGPGTVPVVGQQSELSEIKGRILFPPRELH